jgi:hypothetical protein
MISREQYWIEEFTSGRIIDIQFDWDLLKVTLKGPSWVSELKWSENIQFPNLLPDAIEVKRLFDNFQKKKTLDNLSGVWYSKTRTQTCINRIDDDMTLHQHQLEQERVGTGVSSVQQQRQ